MFPVYTAGVCNSDVIHALYQPLFAQLHTTHSPLPILLSLKISFFSSLFNSLEWYYTKQKELSLRGYICLKKEQLLTLSLSKSQNQRMAEIGRDLWRESGVQSHWGSVTYSQTPRTVPRQLLSISEDGDSTTYLGHVCQDSVILVFKKCFFTFRGNLLCFGLCPLPLVLALGTPEKEPGSVLSASFLQVFILTKKNTHPPSPSLHSPPHPPSGWTVTTLPAFSLREMLQTPQQPCWASSWALSSMSVSLLYWSPRTDTGFQV